MYRKIELPLDCWNFDKANKTVLIERCEYNKKMENILYDITAYRILDYNSTKTVKNKIFR